MERFFFASIIILLTSMNTFGETYLDKPEGVVSNAIESLIKRNFSNILELTELSEKKRAQLIIEKYYNGDKGIIEGELNNIISYKITETYYEKDYSIVEVTWVLKNSFQAKDGQKKYEATRKILYLLKQFDGRWKIISRKVEI
ncbi:MAG: hypothetical protein ACP5QP_04180 [Brevinematia bacterium]|jgi:hypothetical protein